MVKKTHLTILFCIVYVTLFSQSLISYVTVNSNSAYIGQPVELKISVYTSTWFTKGIDVGNIKVDGALTVYFRSVSSSKKFNGKNYAGVEFYYNLFPTKQGVIEIPSLKIRIESPKDGDYKGVKKTISTKPKNLTVKSIPLGYNPQNWLVAGGMTVSNSWSMSLQNIKVGDVIQRTISRYVQGTLSEFIPATYWGTIVNVSIYPKRPQVKTDKSKTGVYAHRIETVNYLFEKEGEIIIPTIEYLYWNYKSKKFYKKTVDSIVINVAPNPDLEILSSIKESLQNESDNITQAEETEFLIFGLTPKTFAKYLILILLILFVLFKFLKWSASVIKKHYSNYLKSEQYAFNQVKKAINKHNYSDFIQKSNTWLNKFSTKQLTLHKLANESKNNELEIILNKLNKSIFKQKETVEKNIYKTLFIEIKKSRKFYIKHYKMKSKLNTIKNKWLNPVT